MQGTIRLIKTWATGHLGVDVTEGRPVPPLDGTLAVVLERQQHLEPLVEAGVVGADTRVFAPGIADGAHDRVGATLLGYDGSLSDAGGDVQIGANFFLQSQDYGTSEYLSLIGTTLVRIVDESDFATFLEDADRARETGEFADFATHPLVRICDITSLGSPALEAGPALRIYVDAAGEISTSPGGATLGEVGLGLDELAGAWKSGNADSDQTCAVSLARAVPEETRAAELRSRPWLGGYHTAISGLRDLRGRNLAELKSVRVSGFGGRLSPELADVASYESARSDAPALLWTDDAAFLHDWASEKTFQLGHGAGRLAERLLVLGSVDAASDGDADQLRTVADFFSKSGVRLAA